MDFFKRIFLYKLWTGVWINGASWKTWRIIRAKIRIKNNNKKHQRNLYIKKREIWTMRCLILFLKRMNLMMNICQEKVLKNKQIFWCSFQAVWILKISSKICSILFNRIFDYKKSSQHYFLIINKKSLRE